MLVYPALKHMRASQLGIVPQGFLGERWQKKIHWNHLPNPIVDGRNPAPPGDG